jgi:type IV secretion system protein VirB9
MTKALKTPALREVSFVGGVRPDKAEQSARISARISGCVFNTTGACVLIAFFSGTCLAQTPLPVGEAAAAPVAPPRQTPAAATQPAQSTSSLSADAKSWPPPINMLSPSAPLNPKSRRGVDLVHRWQSRAVMPTLAERGAVRFIHGATQDTVVCAPLRLCDIELQAGEIVQNVNLGDPVMWSCPPAISGSGAGQITHLMCKPADAGLVTSLAIQTSRRTYSIELTSTRKNYMPRVSWSYPEDQAAQWAAYQQQAGSGGGDATIPANGYIRYDLSGDNPPWHPVVAYSDGKKTYISFPPAMAYGKAPVLERLP